MKWLNNPLLFEVPANAATLINIDAHGWTAAVSPWGNLQGLRWGILIYFGPRTPPPLYNQNSPRSPSLNRVRPLRDAGQRKFLFWPMRSRSRVALAAPVHAAGMRAVCRCLLSHFPFKRWKIGHDVSSKTCSSWVSGRRKVKCLACYWCPSSPCSCCPNVRWLFSRILT